MSQERLRRITRAREALVRAYRARRWFRLQPGVPGIVAHELRMGQERTERLIWLAEQRLALVESSTLGPHGWSWRRWSGK